RRCPRAGLNRLARIKQTRDHMSRRASASAVPPLPELEKRGASLSRRPRLPEQLSMRHVEAPLNRSWRLEDSPTAVPARRLERSCLNQEARDYLSRWAGAATTCHVGHQASGIPSTGAGNVSQVTDMR